MEVLGGIWIVAHTVAQLAQHSSLGGCGIEAARGDLLAQEASVRVAGGRGQGTKGGGWKVEGGHP